MKQCKERFKTWGCLALEVRGHFSSASTKVGVRVYSSGAGVVAR